MAELKFPILTTSDFADLSLNDFQKDSLSLFIAKKEKEYVRALLNDAVYADFVTGVDFAKYNELWNGCTYTDEDNHTRVNEGLKEVVVGFIKAHWLRSNYQKSVVGNVKNSNNEQLSTDNVNTQLCYEEYNRGLNIYLKDIFDFVREKAYTTGYEGFEDFKLPIIDYLYL